MTAKILRLVEDYVFASPASSMNNQITFYKRNLVVQIAPPKDGWVLVKALVDAKSLPAWIPQRLVTKAQAGFYRALTELHLCESDSVRPGDVIELVSIEFFRYGEEPDRLWCEVRLTDGRTDKFSCMACELEAVDVPVGPPGSKNLPQSCPGPLRSIFGSISRLRGHTTGASDSHPPPPYDDSNR